MTRTDLHQGECLTIMDTIPAGSVDMVLCDLPYAATQQSWDAIIPPAHLWAAYGRVCKPKANIVLTATNPFASTMIASKPEWFRYDVIWQKNKTTGFLNVDKMPLRKHELILVFSAEPGGTWNAQKTTGHRPVNGFTKRNKSGKGTYGALRNGYSGGGQTDRFPTSVVDFDVVNNDDLARVHPNQKPLELLEYLIRSYSNGGDVVLDNTMGSGATGVACIHTGRHFVGIEKDSTYFAKGKAWIEESQRKHAAEPRLLEPELGFSAKEIEAIAHEQELGLV